MNLAASSSTPLRDAGRNVQKGFAELGFSLRPDATRSDTASPPELDAQDSEAERQRFELWAANLGLYSLGDRSLDYRLQDAPALNEYTLDLLNELADDLTQIHGIITGHAHPPESESSSDASISDDSDEETDHSEENATFSRPHEDNEDHAEPGQSGAQILFGDVVDIIDRLYKFAAKVRGPTTRSTPSSRNFYRGPYQDPDGTKTRPTAEEREQARLQTEELHTRRVAEVVRQLRRDQANLPSPDSLPIHTFDDSSQAFINRMGKANAYRHQQFIFWREREQKRRLASEQLNVQEKSQVPVPQTLPPPNGEDHSPSNLNVIPSKKTVRIADPTPTEDLVSGVPSQTWNLPKSVNLKEETRSVRSEATHSPTVYEPSGKKVSWPKFPKELLGTKEFICPYCFATCPSHYRGKAHWRSHLIQDLQPYLCTYPECEIGDNKLLGNWEEWILHERISHRMHYACPDHPSQEFHNQKDFSKHIKDKHGREPNRSDFEKAARPLSRPDRTCPLCQYEATEWTDMEQHMAFHLESLALLTLPQATGLEADSDIKSDSGLMQQGSEGIRGSRNRDFGSNPSDVSIEANDVDTATLEDAPSLFSGEALTGEALSKLGADISLEQETPNDSTMVESLSPSERSRFLILHDRFALYDRQHIYELFPKAASDLIASLGTANTARRGWFILHAWTSGNVHSQDEPLPSASEDQPLREATPRTIEVMASPQGIVEQHGDEDLRLRESRSSGLTARYSRSGSHLAALQRMESWLPRPSKPGEARCEFCQGRFSYHKVDDHIAHVYKDLEPYVCFVTDCETRSKRFYSRKAWEDHLDEHTNPSNSICPLCRDDILRSWSDLKSHIALHLKRIALFALPRFSNALHYDSDRPIPPSVISGRTQLSNLSPVSSESNGSHPGEDLTVNSLQKFMSKQTGLVPWVDVYIDQYLHSDTSAEEDVEQHEGVREASGQEPMESRWAQIRRSLLESTENTEPSDRMEIVAQPKGESTTPPSKSVDPPGEQAPQDSISLILRTVATNAANLVTIAHQLSENLTEFQSQMQSHPRTLNRLVPLLHSIQDDGRRILEDNRNGDILKTQSVNSWRSLNVRMVELVEFLVGFTRELGILTKSGATTELGQLLLSRIENDDDDFVIEIKEAYDVIESRYRSLQGWISLVITEVTNLAANTSGSASPSSQLVSSLGQSQHEPGDAQLDTTVPIGEEDAAIPELQLSRVSSQSSPTSHLPQVANEEAQSEASDRPLEPTNPLGHIDLTDSDNIHQSPGIRDVEEVEPQPSERHSKYEDEALLQRTGIMRQSNDTVPGDTALGRESYASPEGPLRGIPPSARSTKISKDIVSIEALQRSRERFEERPDCFIVFRALSRDEIQKLSDLTGIINSTKPVPEQNSYKMLRSTAPSITGLSELGLSSSQHRIPPPPVHRVTCTLYIGNLAAPLASSALHALLQKVASPLPASIEPDPSIIRFFYVSPIRTHAFATFRSTFYSSRVRDTLHGAVWVHASNRQALWVDYVPDEVVPAWVAAESAAADGPEANRRWEVVYLQDHLGNSSIATLRKEEVGVEVEAGTKMPPDSSQDVVTEVRTQQALDTSPTEVQDDGGQEDQPSSVTATDEAQSLPSEGQWVWNRARKTFYTYVGKDPEGNDMFEYNDDPYSRSRPFVKLPPDVSVGKKPQSTPTGSLPPVASSSQATGRMIKNSLLDALTSGLLIKVDSFYQKFTSTSIEHEPTDHTLMQLRSILSRIGPAFDGSGSRSILATRRREHAIEVLQECERRLSALERILDHLIAVGGGYRARWMSGARGPLTSQEKEFKLHSELLKDSVDTLSLRLTHESIKPFKETGQEATAPAPPLTSEASGSVERSGSPESAPSSETFRLSSPRLTGPEGVNPPVTQRRHSSRFSPFSTSTEPRPRQSTRLSSRSTDDDSSTKSGCVLM